MKKRIISSLLALLILVSICPQALAYSTVKNGSSGSDVRTLQTMLNKVSNAGLTVDGVFGANTQAALKRYQSANGLTADGICGSQTWAKLSTHYSAGWEIQMPSSVTVEQGKSTYVDIRFRGSGISSYGGKISNSSAVGATFSNTQWKPAGEWCSVRLNLTGKATGTATVTFTLYGSVTLSNSITINVTQPNAINYKTMAEKTFEVQTGSGCVLTSYAMLVKSKLYLEGKSYSGISQSTIKSYNNGNADAYWDLINRTIAQKAGTTGTLSTDVRKGYSSASNKAYIINLLKSRPEGVLVYFYKDGNNQHAVLFRNYDSATDTFYVSDPGGSSYKYVTLQASRIGNGVYSWGTNLNTAFSYVNKVVYYT